MVQSGFLCYSSNLLAPSILWEEFFWIRLCCFVHPLGHISLSGFNGFVLCWPGAGHIIALLFVYGPLGRTRCFLQGLSTSSLLVSLAVWSCAHCAVHWGCLLSDCADHSYFSWDLGSRGTFLCLRWLRAWQGQAGAELPRLLQLYSVISFLLIIGQWLFIV